MWRYKCGSTYAELNLSLKSVGEIIARSAPATAANLYDLSHYSIISTIRSIEIISKTFFHKYCSYRNERLLFLIFVICNV